MVRDRLARFAVRRRSARARDPDRRREPADRPVRSRDADPRPPGAHRPPARHRGPDRGDARARPSRPRPASWSIRSWPSRTLRTAANAAADDRDGRLLHAGRTMAAGELLMTANSSSSRPAADRPAHAATPARPRSERGSHDHQSARLPDIRELKPRITVFGVGGAGGNAVNNMITAGLLGCDFVVANTDAQALTLVEGRAHHPDGHSGDRGPRRRLAARRRPRGRRGGDRRDPRSSRRRAHGVRHRRHGRRHRHRRRAGHRAGRQGTRHPHRRRRHQAVPLRGRSAACASPSRASPSCRRRSTR